MKTYYILLVSILFIATSCNLDREPYGNRPVATEQDLALELNGAYAPFYEEEGFGRGHWWVGSASDDMIVNRSKPAEEALTEFRTPVNSSGYLYDNWQNMYRVIKRANDVLRDVQTINIPQSSKDMFIGDANFLCAFSYFFLEKRYGGLPFYDNNNPAANSARLTKEETFTRIEAYLKEAIKSYEAQNAWVRSDDDWGKPNLGAAYGLLAKVYAHWGKFPECQAAAEKVINSGKYTLDETNGNGFAHLFSPAGEKGSEVLFNLGCNALGNQGTITSVVTLSGIFSGGTGWHYFAPTKSLYDAFEPGDLRRKVTLVGAGDTIHYLGIQTVLTAALIPDMATGLMCNKYAAAYNDLSSWSWSTGEDVPLLRYSDVLLLDAEAIMMQAGAGPKNRNQGVAAAAPSLNKVRLRAFGGDMSKVIAAPTFNDLVRERRCELAYEDERHYDLVRWGMATEVYAAATPSMDPRGPRIFDPVKDAAFPLPQTEIDNTDGVLINNPLPGYSSF